MISRTACFSISALVFSFFVLVACGSKLVLISKTAEVPAGVDLSGSWLLREDPNAAGLSGNAEIRDGLILTGRSTRSRRQQGRSEGSVQIFLELGEALKITQTEFGMFISYDRSVVEEYTFGENRLVAIGPIEAVRVSGWENGAFVVETLDDARSTLTETWRLQDGDKVLRRDIRIGKGEHEIFSLVQILDRQ